jgi:hypothetical protein
MVTKLSKAQELQLELIKDASFNCFDGPRVVEDLLKHRDLWKGVMMTRDYAPLISLRDISICWNVDTLYLEPQEDREHELEKIVMAWNADELAWLDGEEASSKSGAYPGIKLLRLWWD